MIDRSALRFSGPRLAELREEAGLTRKTLGARLGLPWQLVSLWEASVDPDSPRAYPAHEPTSSQLQDLARELDCHPVDLFLDLQDAPASEREEEWAAGMASGIRLDGEKLARMRRLRGLSYPQAAARARVPVAVIQAAESGRTINTGALLRLLQVYEPRRDPTDKVKALIVRMRSHGRRD